MNSPVILSREVLKLDAAFDARQAAIAPSSIDRIDGWYMSKYFGQSLVTYGCWCTPRDAMSRNEEVAPGEWIAVNSKLWHSPDGRWIISAE